MNPLFIIFGPSAAKYDVWLLHMLPTNNNTYTTASNGKSINVTGMKFEKCKIQRHAFFAVRFH